MNRLRLALDRWVVGDHFWDREDDLARFINRIEEGAHLLLIAPPRMGKTSLMREAARRLQDRYLCLYVDLEKARAPADMLVQLSLQLRPHKTLWPKAKQVFATVAAKFSHVIDRLKPHDLALMLRPGVTAEDWSDKADQLMAVLAASNKPVLVLMDELPTMVNRILKGNGTWIRPERRASADELLSWLQETPRLARHAVRIVLSGRIGLEPILRQARLGTTLNTFLRFGLKPWEEAAAVGCLRALAAEYGVEFQMGAAEEMVRRLGCSIPYHVQIFFDQALAACKQRNSMKTSLEDVDTIYNERMLGPPGNAELTHHVDRLKRLLDEELFPLALGVLTEAAVSGRLSVEACRRLNRDYEFRERSFPEARDEVLFALDQGGYLVPTPQGYAFASTLVRDWWKVHRSSGYVPVLQRGD